MWRRWTDAGQLYVSIKPRTQEATLLNTSINVTHYCELRWEMIFDGSVLINAMTPQIHVSQCKCRGCEVPAVIAVCSLCSLWLSSVHESISHPWKMNKVASFRSLANYTLFLLNVARVPLVFIRPSSSAKSSSLQQQPAINRIPMAHSQTIDEFTFSYNNV